MREPQCGVLEPTGETETVRARYVVGADGANSFVRAAAGIGFEDQGFAERWLVVDLRPDDVDALSYLPAPCQWCDPVRPHMHTRNGRTHRRFEFMLLPGERPEDFADVSRAWALLEPWFTPADGVLVRHAIYEFRGRLADHHARRPGRCSPATPRTRCRRSWARACARACATQRTSRGGWTSSSRGASDDDLLDGYTAERHAARTSGS